MKLVIPQRNIRTGTAAVIFELSAALFLSVSFWMTVFSMLGVSLTGPVVLLIILLPAVQYGLSRVKPVGRFLVFYTLLLCAAAMLVWYRFFSGAFLELFNTIIEAANREGRSVITLFSTGISGGSEAAYLLAAEAVCILVWSAVTAVCARDRKPFWCVLISVVPVVAGLLFLPAPKLIFLGLFLAALTAFFCLCAARGSTASKKAGRHVRFGPAWSMVGAVLVFVLLFAGIFYHYSGAGFITKQRTALNAKVQEYRYGPDTVSDGMPNGDLTSASSISYKGNILFEVKMENPSSMYFRSYVGDRFSGGKWSSLDNSAYTGSYLGMNTWLEQQGFYPWAQLSSVYAMDAERTGSGARTGTVSISNSGADSSRIYTPYEVVVQDDTKQLGTLTDAGFFASGLHGKRSYSLTTYVPLYDDYGAEDFTPLLKTLSSSSQYASYEKAEKVYRSFVYDNYLEVPSAYAQVVENTGAGALGGKRYCDAVYGVRKYLEDNFTYSETIKDSGSLDPLIYFASVSKKGYEAQFATLAVLMFRQAGIPARYAEGYYLSPDEMAGYENNTNADFEVYDTAAHAWAEIYEDGVGWVPVEVTPGYFTLDEKKTDKTAEKTQKLNKKNDAIYYDDTETGKSTKPAPVQNNRMPLWAILVICAAGALLLLLAAYRLRIALLTRSIRKADGAPATLRGYRFLLSMLRRRRYPLDRPLPYNLVPILGPAFSAYLDLVYKEVYSEHGLSADERSAASAYVLQSKKELPKCPKEQRQKKRGKNSSRKRRFPKRKAAYRRREYY